MDEAYYWTALEFRLCREFAGMPERHLRYWWCDGFHPKWYYLDDSIPRIMGQVWICNGPKQEEWEFTLFLPKPVRVRAEVDWASLLPPENVTRWLALDETCKLLQIEPVTAVPDLA